MSFFLLLNPNYVSRLKDFDMRKDMYNYYMGEIIFPIQNWTCKWNIPMLSLRTKDVKQPNVFVDLKDHEARQCLAQYEFHANMTIIQRLVISMLNWS